MVTGGATVVAYAYGNLIGSYVMLFGYNLVLDAGWCGGPIFTKKTICSFE